jgi:hypothetical protein
LAILTCKASIRRNFIPLKCTRVKGKANVDFISPLYEAPPPPPPCPCQKKIVKKDRESEVSVSLLSKIKIRLF